MVILGIILGIVIAALIVLLVIYFIFSSKTNAIINSIPVIIQKDEEEKDGENKNILDVLQEGVEKIIEETEEKFNSQIGKDNEEAAEEVEAKEEKPVETVKEELPKEALEEKEAEDTVKEANTDSEEKTEEGIKDDTPDVPKDDSK